MESNLTGHLAQIPTIHITTTTYVRHPTTLQWGGVRWQTVAQNHQLLSAGWTNEGWQQEMEMELLRCYHPGASLQWGGHVGAETRTCRRIGQAFGPSFRGG